MFCGTCGVTLDAAAGSSVMFQPQQPFLREGVCRRLIPACGPGSPASNQGCVPLWRRRNNLGHIVVIEAAGHECGAEFGGHVVVCVAIAICM